MASSSAASSSSTPSWKYDVFLSFRGEDTRRNFTDHLHTELKQFGINTFIDDQLRRGEQISPALLQAIEDSMFSIIIFSQNYAYSSWCLEELTKIIECVHKGKHTAFPVFYEVDPSDVRKQRGSYEEAFKRHEEAYKNNMEKVVKWRGALTGASGYSGWDTRDRHHAEIIKEIVFKIFNKVPKIPSSSNKIGLESRIKAVLSLLRIGSHDVRMVGIWGMGGIGKTTIAEAIYQTIHAQFEGFCLLSNVREKSQRNENLQMELLSKILREKNLDDSVFNSEADSIRKILHMKKVLIVLDDVSDREQLEKLVGDHDWFGIESRIIITTRNKRLLDEKDIDATYEVKELQRDEAFMLFRQHAFKNKSVEDDFEELCYRSLDYTKGNPLAIKILGSSLYKRTKKEWKCELEKLKKFPNKDVQKVLRISFDGLDDNVKEIFLDIACFFKRKDKDYISELLKSCNLYPETGIPTLIERALITISYGNKLDMHDLIQEMGWTIVRQQSTEDLGNQSRLWLNKDVEDVLNYNRGTKQIQGIVLDLSASKELKFNVDVFKKMSNLRLLRFHNEPIDKTWQCFPSEGCKFHLTGNFEVISNNLSYLCWHKYPLKSLPSEFDPSKLVELNMSFSQLEELWLKPKPCPNLVYIDLSYCRVLKKTPDLSKALVLKRLNLEACSNLIEVHPSITSLKNLSFLNLKDCSKLKELPEGIGQLTSLEILNLYGCSKLKELPESIGRLSLETLNLSGCSTLKALPESICKLTSLETLNLFGCLKLEKLPDDLGRLSRLVSLVADGSGIQELPPSINLLTKIEEISLARCKRRVSNPWSFALSLFPSTRKGLRLSSLSGLGSLKSLNLSDCKLLEGALPSDMSSLCSLEYLNLSKNNFITLPSLTRLTNLLTLELESCKSLQSLIELPSSIEIVRANNCKSLETFSYPLNSYTSWESEGAVLDFYNCQRLLKKEQNVNMGAIIPSITAAFNDRRYRKYSAIIGGRDVPEWFIHQNVGDSVIVKLPQNFDGSRPLGLAFCAALDDNHINMRAPMHSPEYENIWIGYISFPPNFMEPDNCAYRRVVSYSEGDGDDSGCYKHPIISHLLFSFFKYQPEGPDVKKCGIRLLYEPPPKDMMNEGTMEYVPVPAISCPPEMTSSQGCCWQIDLDFNYLGRSHGLGFEVLGYHECEFYRETRKRKRTGASLTLVEAPLAGAKTSIDMPQPIQDPRPEDAQDIS